MTALLNASLRVADLEERAERAQMRGDIGGYLDCLNQLAGARTVLQRRQAVKEARAAARRESATPDGVR